MKKKVIIVTCVMALLVANFIHAKGSDIENRSTLDENVEALADDGDTFIPDLNYSICYSESKVLIGYTYYDCGTCKKVYDEKGKGRYSKCNIGRL